MLGFMAGNIISGMVKQYHWHDVEYLPRDGSVTLLDVRKDEEVAKGRIEGTIHIPVDELRDRMGELDSSKPIFVNCQSGLRSYIACRMLAQNGFNCYNLAGGYRLYDSVTNDPVFDSTPKHPCGIDIL